jgi:hypothetical protein
MSGFPDHTDWDDEVGGVRDRMTQALDALRARLASGATNRGASTTS